MSGPLSPRVIPCRCAAVPLCPPAASAPCPCAPVPLCPCAMGAVALRRHASDPALPLGRKSGGANRDRTDDLLLKPTPRVGMQEGRVGGPWRVCLPCQKDGGANRDRTDDLLHAMQALYQLSYGPISRLKAQQIPPPPCRSNLFYPHSPPLPTLAKGRLGGLPCCR